MEDFQTGSVEHRGESNITPAADDTTTLADNTTSAVSSPILTHTTMIESGAIPIIIQDQELIEFDELHWDEDLEDFQIRSVEHQRESNTTPTAANTTTMEPSPYTVTLPSGETLLMDPGVDYSNLLTDNFNYELMDAADNILPDNLRFFPALVYSSLSVLLEIIFSLHLFITFITLYPS